jgi:hypothetical protein
MLRLAIFRGGHGRHVTPGQRGLPVVIATACGAVLPVCWWMMEDIRDDRRSSVDALAGKERRVRLRDVALGDVDAYVRCGAIRS